MEVAGVRDEGLDLLLRVALVDEVRVVEGQLDAGRLRRRAASPRPDPARSSRDGARSRSADRGRGRSRPGRRARPARARTSRRGSPRASRSRAASSGPAPRSARRARACRGTARRPRSRSTGSGLFGAIVSKSVQGITNRSETARPRPRRPSLIRPAASGIAPRTSSGRMCERFPMQHTSTAGSPSRPMISHRVLPRLHHPKGVVGARESHDLGTVAAYGVRASVDADAGRRRGDRLRAAAADPSSSAQERAAAPGLRDPGAAVDGQHRAVDVGRRRRREERDGTRRRPRGSPACRPGFPRRGPRARPRASRGRPC